MNLGIAFGAGLYEQRRILPQWFSRSPESGLRADSEAMRRTDAGRKFWAYVTTVPLTLLMLTSPAVAWQTQGPRRDWWFGAAVIILVERIGTFSYFIPTALKLMRIESLPESAVDSMVSQWMRLNYIRDALTLVGWIAALKALYPLRTAAGDRRASGCSHDVTHDALSESLFAV
ncbi:MAG: DUF1772 domain-containing protein [Nitrospiraceae bacterium]